MSGICINWFRINDEGPIVLKAILSIADFKMVYRYKKKFRFLFLPDFKSYIHYSDVSC